MKLNPDFSLLTSTDKMFLDAGNILTEISRDCACIKCQFITRVATVTISSLTFLSTYQKKLSDPDSLTPIETVALEAVLSFMKSAAATQNTLSSLTGELYNLSSPVVLAMDEMKEDIH